MLRKTLPISGFAWCKKWWTNHHEWLLHNIRKKSYFSNKKKQKLMFKFLALVNCKQVKLAAIQLDFDKSEYLAQLFHNSYQTFNRIPSLNRTTFIVPIYIYIYEKSNFLCQLKFCKLSVFGALCFGHNSAPAFFA